MRLLPVTLQSCISRFTSAVNQIPSSVQKVAAVAILVLLALSFAGIRRALNNVFGLVMCKPNNALPVSNWIDKVRGQNVVIDIHAIRVFLGEMDKRPLADVSLFADCFRSLKLYSKHNDPIEPLNAYCLFLEHSTEYSPHVADFIAKLLGNEYHIEAKKIHGNTTPGANLMALFDKLPYPSNVPDYLMPTICSLSRSCAIMGRLCNPPEIHQEIRELLPFVVLDITPKQVYEIIYAQAVQMQLVFKNGAEQLIACILSPEQGKFRDLKVRELAQLLNSTKYNPLKKTHRLENCTPTLFNDLLKVVAPETVIALVTDNDLDFEGIFHCPISYQLPKEPVKTTCCDQELDKKSWQSWQDSQPRGRVCCPFCRRQGTIEKDQRMAQILELWARASRK